MTIWSCGAAWTTAIFLSCEAPSRASGGECGCIEPVPGLYRCGSGAGGDCDHFLYFQTDYRADPAAGRYFKKNVRAGFETRYEGKEKNEIGILGNNINEMAEKLEQAISELKTANNELQRDIEQKTKVDEMRKEFLSERFP